MRNHEKRLSFGYSQLTRTGDSYDFAMDSILANLTGITAMLTHIKIDQKLNKTDIANLKDKAFKDLNGLSKYVHTLFIMLESLKKKCASTSQLSSSHDALSERLDFLNNNLASKIY